MDTLKFSIELEISREDLDHMDSGEVADILADVLLVGLEQHHNIIVDYLSIEREDED